MTDIGYTIVSTSSAKEVSDVLSQWIGPFYDLIEVDNNKEDPKLLDIIVPNDAIDWPHYRESGELVQVKEVKKVSRKRKSKKSDSETQDISELPNVEVVEDDIEPNPELMTA